MDIQLSCGNDSLFLSSLNVMDYSLLVGVTADSRTLLVGIIDYMRKYTWDKQLESWVKSSGTCLPHLSGHDTTDCNFSGRLSQTLLQCYLRVLRTSSLYS